MLNLGRRAAVLLLVVLSIADVQAATKARKPVRSGRTAKSSIAKSKSSPLPQGQVPTLANLSLHDKIAQLIVVRGYGDYPSHNNAEYRHFLRWIQEDHVGGFIIAGRINNGNVISAQPFEMTTFINDMQRLATTPLLIASDFERGASARTAGTALFPYQMAFGAAHDLASTKALGAATAREARSLGVQWVFAPDADVNNNPDNPIINIRSFGEDPVAVASNVSSFIDGAHSDPDNYVLVTAKHFPGHGDTAEDSHLQLARLNQTKERIKSLELVPFRAAVQHGVDAIMTAHMAVPAFASEDEPATLSTNVLTGLLRSELNFNGLIVTDALEMQGIASLYSQGEAAVRAIHAGADVLLMPVDPEPCIKAIAAAVGNGRILLSRIDQSVSKILAAKKQVGLFQNRYVEVSGLAEKLDDSRDTKLAQHVAERAFTLVKDDKHQFPVLSPEGACLIVIGEGTFNQRGETLTAELRRELKNLKLYVVGPNLPSSALDAIAAETSHCSSIYAASFITAGTKPGVVAVDDGFTRFLHTLEAGATPVALISLGNPYLLRDFPNVSAYAATFSITQSSESAVAKAILGKIAINGKLPVSIPGVAKLGDGLAVPARGHSTSNGSNE